MTGTGQEEEEESKRKGNEKEIGNRKMIGA